MDGEYQIITQGMDNGGEYTVATGYFTEKEDGTTTSAEADYVGTTTPGTIQELKAMIDSTNPETITVEPTDVTPPMITITSPKAQNYLRSQILPIEVTINDDTSVASQSILFDTKIVQNKTSLDLFYEKLGTHKLLVRASDPFGNQSSASVSFQIIATYDSAISDINRAFTLGWIKKKAFRDYLIQKLKAAQAKKKPQQQDNLLKQLLAELKKKQAKELTPHGYLLLKEDIEWVKGHN